MSRMIKLKDLIKEEDINPKVEDEVEKAFSDAISKSMGDFSSIGKEVQKKTQDQKSVEDAFKKTPELKKIANESMRRRNEAISEGDAEKQQLNEVGALFAISLAIALPRIVELIGKAIKAISTSMGGQGKVGEKLEKAGHEWHEKIIDLMEKGLQFIPGFKNLPTDKQEKIAKVLHTLIIGGLAVSSGAGAVTALMKGKSALAGVEGALTAVKAGELDMSKFASAAISKILS